MHREWSRRLAILRPLRWEGRNDSGCTKLDPDICLGGGNFCGWFFCLQFIRPTLTNPPVTAELQAPPEVKQILRNSCYNCHSNETQLPWFDKVVPAYWLVTSDVKEARRHLNFSEIGKLPAAQQKAFLFEAVNMIQLGAMPLPAYLHVHPGAAITPEQLAVLRNYLTAPADKVRQRQQRPRPGPPVLRVLPMLSTTSGFTQAVSRWMCSRSSTGWRSSRTTRTGR